jgi:hypothetical protein
MTTILIKKKDTAGAPAAGDLTNAAGGAEIAVNTATKRIYTKDSGGNVVEVGTNPTATTMNGNLTFVPDATYDIGASGVTRPRNLFLSGAATLGTALTVPNGGTGLTTLATGSLSYGAGTSAFSTLAIGTAGQILTVNSGATAPQWSTLSGVAVTTFSAGTTGFTPNTATSGAITLAGTLATTNGGTGLTSFTSGGVVYASSSSALATGSALNFDGTNLGLGGTTNTYGSQTTFTLSGTQVSRIDFRSNNVFTGTILSYQGITEGLRLSTETGYPIVFSPANTEAGRFTAAGSFGVGTSTPAAKLEVAGVNNLARFSSSSAAVTLDISTPTVDVIGIVAGTSDALYFGTNSTERVRITSAGNVGFGVSSPTAIIHSYSTDLGDGGGLKLQNGGSGGGTFSIWPTATVNGEGANKLIFSGSVGNIFTLVGANGNAGIGTVSPNEKLQVAGSIRVTSNASDFNTTGSQLDFVPGSGAGRISSYESTGSNLQFYTNISGGNVTERMRISSAGAVSKPFQPGFEAYNSSDTTYNGTAQNTAIVYNATYRNTGSHYNTGNGLFTAPVSGYYAFFAGGYINFGSVTQIWCIQNGSRTVSMAVKNSSGTPGDTVSGSAIVFMTAGDTFGVFVYSTLATNPTTLYSNPYHTFFKGYFLG